MILSSGDISIWSKSSQDTLYYTNALQICFSVGIIIIIFIQHFWFQLIDKNNDGNVTLDELIEWCSRDEGILQSLDTLDTVL